MHCIALLNQLYFHCNYLFADCTISSFVFCIGAHPIATGNDHFGREYTILQSRFFIVLWLEHARGRILRLISATWSFVHPSMAIGRCAIYYFDLFSF